MGPDPNQEGKGWGEKLVRQPQNLPQETDPAGLPHGQGGIEARGSRNGTMEEGKAAGGRSRSNHGVRELRRHHRPLPAFPLRMCPTPITLDLNRDHNHGGNDDDLHPHHHVVWGR